jgi:hypothetical protein
MMQRLAVLGPLYDGLVPKAALYLDDMIDQGRLPVFRGKDEGNLVPIKEIAAFCQDQGSVRESIHNLHAIGALLVFIDEEHSAPYIRMVTKRPEPGQPWQFNGDSDVAVSTVCVPSHIWEELPLDVAAAVGFMRACRSQLEKPDPVVYGRHAGVNGAEHARELFAAAEASGYVDYKGCDACPAGHLCTRP